MHECLIAVGGNLQISEHVFNDAMQQLRLRGCRDIYMSRVLKTRAVGVNAGAEFLNAAAVLYTDQSPADLLRTLHEIEAMFQRVRTCHWGPRTLDIDLILYGEFTSDTPQLVVPHPAMWYRRFVLDPAIDVAANMVHPILSESVKVLHERLSCRPLRLEICGTNAIAGTTFLSDSVNQVLASRIEGIEWRPSDSASAIEQESFARIVLQRVKQQTACQPLNRKHREIEVRDETVAGVVSQIEQLCISMLG